MEMKEMLKLIGVGLKFFGVMANLAIILALCTPVLYIAYKGSQPMNVPQAPEDMTYFEFMADRVDAAKTVQPARCGWGMIASLAVLGPVYSVIYTEIGLHPDGFLARGAAPDPDVPKNVAGEPWYQVPGIWWNTVERLSWTMLGKPSMFGCKLRQVNSTKY
jgi:hypothetical protein